MTTSSSLPPRTSFDNLADLFLTDHDQPQVSAESSHLSNPTSSSSLELRDIEAVDQVLQNENHIQDAESPEEHIDLITGDHEETGSTAQFETMASSSEQISDVSAGEFLTLVGSDPDQTENDDDHAGLAPPIGPTAALSHRAQVENRRTPIHTSAIDACLASNETRLWINQMVAKIAHTHGITALVSLHDGGQDQAIVTIDAFSGVDLTDATKSPRNPHDAVIWNEIRRLGQGPVDSLKDALQRLVPLVRHWMVQDRRQLMNSTQPSLPVSHSEVSSIQTIMAIGAESASLVKAFRKIKSGATPASPRLFYVGVNKDTAQQTHARIIGSLQSTMSEHQIQFAGSLHRMEPVDFVYLGEHSIRLPRVSVEATGLESHIIELIQSVDANFALHNAPNDATQYTQSVRKNTEVLPAICPLPSSERAFDLSDPLQQKAVAPCKENGTQKKDVRLPCEPKADRPIRAASDCYAANEVIAASTSLTRMVTTVRDLGVRCPKAPNIELAIDDLGTVHALFADESCGGSNERVSELLSVCDWIEDHAALLAMMRTIPEAIAMRLAQTTSVQTIAHLFTQHPRQYRHLMDSRLRIHLLARPADVLVNPNSPVDGTNNGNQAVESDAWVHVEIN